VRESLAMIGSASMGGREGYLFGLLGVPCTAMIGLRVSCTITRFAVVTCRIEIGGRGWSGLSLALLGS